MSEPTIHNPIQRTALKAIRWYQRNWSPDHSARKQFYPYGYCRYTPTCSEYGHDAIAKYGVLRGGLMTSWRILRCNHWSRGGYDPVK